VLGLQFSLAGLGVTFYAKEIRVTESICVAEVLFELQWPSIKNAPASCDADHLGSASVARHSLQVSA
jgi:hypothetical protein